MNLRLFYEQKGSLTDARAHLTVFFAHFFDSYVHTIKCHT